VDAVFEDCTRSSVTLEASAYVAATLKHLSHAATGGGGDPSAAQLDAAQAGQGDDAGGAAPAAREAEEGGDGGSDACWGWACLCHPSSSAHTDVGSEADEMQAACSRQGRGDPAPGFDDRVLECFLARAGTDLSSAYLAHLALASRPQLLARAFRSAVSYQLQAEGGEGRALAALDARRPQFIGDIRAGANEVAQGLLVRAMLAVTSFRQTVHAGLSVSLTACHLRAGATASPGDSDVCGQGGSAAIVHEGVMDWNAAVQRYQSRHVIATRGLVGLVRFDLAVHCNVVGLGKVAFSISDTKMVGLPVDLRVRALAVRAASEGGDAGNDGRRGDMGDEARGPTPPRASGDAGDGDTPDDANLTCVQDTSSSSVHAEHDDPAPAGATPRSSRPLACAGEEPSGDAKDPAHDINGRRRHGRRSREEEERRRGGEEERKSREGAAARACTYSVGSRVPLGTNFTIDVDFFGGDDAALRAVSG
jgi:hypothetical protein